MSEMRADNWRSETCERNLPIAHHVQKVSQIHQRKYNIVEWRRGISLGS